MDTIAVVVGSVFLAGSLIAVLWMSIRRRLERLIDRRIYLREHGFESEEDLKRQNKKVMEDFQAESRS